MIKGSLMLNLGPIWYLSEPSDVPYSQNLPRPISWFGLFLQQNDYRTFFFLTVGQNNFGNKIPFSAFSPNLCGIPASA